MTDDNTRATSPTVPAIPVDREVIPATALPERIGRLHLGDSRSDGERLCSHSHEVPAGHPLYWPERMGEYPDDMDPLCLAHAIGQAESDSGWCETCLAQEAASPAYTPRPVDDGLEDEIADAIDDSLDMDWTGSIGARAVMKLLRAKGMVA